MTAVFEVTEQIININLKLESQNDRNSIFRKKNKYSKATIAINEMMEKREKKNKWYRAYEMCRAIWKR